MSSCKGVETPLPTSLKLKQPDSTLTVSTETQSFPFANILGGIRYLVTCTRPDICFATNLLSRYMKAPSLQHIQHLKRLMRYLQHTKDYGICFYATHPLPTPFLFGYSDADWGGGDQEMLQSTSGFVYLLARGSISWQSKKQDRVTLSSTEAEYVAMTLALKERIWLKHLLMETTLFANQLLQLLCDNMSAIMLARNLKHSEKTKHIAMKLQFIRELIQEGTIELTHVRSDQQLADFLTKSILKAKHLESCCYVITHGIGTELGFKAAATDSQHPVPRWFSRTWTIQESILPEKLMFIVEKFDGESIIKKLYQEGVFLWELSEEWHDWDKPLDPNVEWGIHKRTGDISRRRAYKEFYCLGAEAYRRMMQIALHPFWQWSEFTKAFSELGDGRDSIEVESVVELVQTRHCSVEEDRLLSILGLLGIAGEHQLRTKQTLDQQLVWLARTLMKENPKLLINLSTADFEGYTMRCISWLPNLRYAEHRRFLYPGQQQYKSFVVDRHLVKVKCMQDDGKIVLSARMLHGTLQVRGRAFCLEIGDHEVKLNGYHTQQPRLLSLEKESTVASDGSLRRSGGFSIPAHRIDELNHLSGYQRLAICEITLLMLGYCHPCDYPYTLAMACIGTTKEMQKVGILGIPPREELLLLRIVSSEVLEMT
ncbi:hypothetical protein L7F22_000864 [Adiantum nelumboides]|nr:hypothetical protein [Adiantum nelumboides]